MSDAATRDSSKTVWAIVAVIAIVAIVALGVVYMNSADRESAARQDATVQFEAAQRGLADAVEGSALAAQEAAERAESAAEATGEALSGAADATAEAASDAAAGAEAAITLPPGGSVTVDRPTAP